MDPRLLRAYNDELEYLRKAAHEFGVEHEEVAGRLGLKAPDVPDPYVERLLEGVAFLAARVRLKQDDQFPEFTQHLLQAVQPDYLSPTPSICIVGFEPDLKDAGLAQGIPGPRHSTLTAPTPGHATPCTFRTAHAVTLLPLRVDKAEYLPNRMTIAAAAAAAGVRADAGLRVVLKATGGTPLSAIQADMLPVYLDGPESIPGLLHRQLLGETIAVVARSPDRPGEWVRLKTPVPYGFDDDCAVLPAHGRSFRGYRVLREYFACPERFLFVALRDIRRAFAGRDEAVELFFLFQRPAAGLMEAVTEDALRLFCTPAVNLFEKQLGRTPVKPFTHEHLVTPDRTRPEDFEVYGLLSMTAHPRTGPARPVAPIYASGALLHDSSEALFYAARLRNRRLSTKERRYQERGDYVGTETLVSLAAPGKPERVDEVHELSVTALVTNRELPELLRLLGSGNAFTLTEPPVEEVVVRRSPTRPRPPLGLADGAWRVIGHLTPNYASLAGNADGDPSRLRDHLELYRWRDEQALSRQTGSVISIHAEPVTRRVNGHDRLAFARGQRLRIVLDDGAFDRGRMFLFATMLSHFLAEFVSINTFVETQFESPEEGVFAKWPARTGQRPTI